ncbi:cinA_cterm, competence/damage-inducible protein CinA C-terminal domain [Rhabdaerophilaceae bacterium]
MSSRPDSIPALARHVLASCRSIGLTIATAESCTGGLVAAALTGIAGSSDVFDRGFVTYSNAAKIAMLGVPEALISSHGAVSREVASAMAEGALAKAGAGVAVAITGIAGPGGGNALKPVGLVHFAAVASLGHVNRIERRYSSNLSRRAIRQLATRDALLMLKDLAERAGRQPT